MELSLQSVEHLHIDVLLPVRHRLLPHCRLAVGAGAGHWRGVHIVTRRYSPAVLKVSVGMLQVLLGRATIL
jgi:hypothetical protein